MRTSLPAWFAGISLLTACGKADAPAAPPPPTAPAPAADSADVDPALLKAFGALPTRMDAPGDVPSAALIDLGRTLYFEKRLSKNQDISCNSCHDLKTFGVDNKPTSPGHRAQLGARNSPTVYNAAGKHTQFWDGRAADVEAQALGPVMNPVEMAMPTEERVVEILKSIPDYVTAFQKAFPDAADPVTFKNMGDAIGAFERGLVTPSPWDRFLAGDQSALNDAEKKGFKTFVAVGCTACHAGTLRRRRDVPKAWPDEALGVRQGSRPLRRHPRRQRQAGVQRPRTPQHRENRPLFS